LESRTIADVLIGKFDLKRHYDEELLQDVYEVLKDRTKFEVSDKAQIVSVSVEDEDPVRAAQMANAYVEALDQINRTVNTTEGHRKRVFLESRLETVKVDLAKAETALREFQEKYKIVAIEEQAKAAIDGAAMIVGQIIAAQTELEVLKQFGTERQNEAVVLKAKIEELQRQLSKIETRNPAENVIKDDKTGKQNGLGFYIPFDELPNLGLQLVRRMREAKIQEEVFKLLTSQYELAKVEEAKDVNTIQVLDRAVPPDKKSSPKMAVIVILSTVGAFFLAIFAAFFLEYLQRMKTDEPDHYQQIVSHFRFPVLPQRWRIRIFKKS
jgi:tyrosine-protein kinase Etk/Wzc